MKKALFFFILFNSMCFALPAQQREKRPLWKAELAGALNNYDAWEVEPSITFLPIPYAGIGLGLLFTQPYQDGSISGASRDQQFLWNSTTDHAANYFLALRPCLQLNTPKLWMGRDKDYALFLSLSPGLTLPLPANSEFNIDYYPNQTGAWTAIRREHVKNHGARTVYYHLRTALSLEVDNGLILSAGYTYRNPVNGLFFNLRPMYVSSSGNILYESTMDSDTYVQKATDRTYRFSTYILGSRLAKSFLWCRTRLGLSGSANSTEYAYLLNGTVQDGKLNTYSVALDYSIRPFRWWTVEGKSAMRISHRNQSSNITDWSHFLDFHLIPSSRWMFTINNELYHSNDKGFGLNYFCDVSLHYKKDRWEISLLGNNIIGTSEYRHVSISATIQSYTLTYLRSREVMLQCSIQI